MDPGRDPTAGFFQGWLLLVHMIGILSDPGHTYILAKG